MTEAEQGIILAWLNAELAEATQAKLESEQSGDGFLAARYGFICVTFEMVTLKLLTIETERDQTQRLRP